MINMWDCAGLENSVTKARIDIFFIYAYFQYLLLLDRA